ncbi:hypothetical protein AOC05_04100 [Arthrobacter alpinus]|uniref:DUF4870 domain-containing protein n=1 Tax=Arthrobacter alpinus TaxID=656366 RepID=A0A0M5LXC7_9MICC|nr:DUF4870 domain-containing protein [Arthrobacter alpinus]ALE91712.1 hypothetical protein AOC05_04100 [Arthrobacter alpinus]
MSDNNSPTPPVEPTPPGYDAPATSPVPPAYQQPVQQQQPYGQPPVPPAYQQQPYQQQPYQQQTMADPASAVTLNYWLSVFFSWIPALIFFLTEKGKNGFSDEYNKANLNFSILRGITGLLVVIPYVGVIFGFLALALFIIHIIAAVDAPKKFRSGQPYKFPFNIAFIK